MTLLLPASKQNSRGTSIVTLPSARCAMSTGVPLNHDCSQARSAARAPGEAARWSAVTGAAGFGAGAEAGAAGGATLVQPTTASAASAK